MTFGTKGFRAVKKAFKPVVASRQFHASRSSRGDQWLLPEDGTAGAGTYTGMRCGLCRSPRGRPSDVASALRCGPGVLPSLGLLSGEHVVHLGREAGPDRWPPLVGQHPVAPPVVRPKVARERRERALEAATRDSSGCLERAGRHPLVGVVGQLVEHPPDGVAGRGRRLREATQILDGPADVAGLSLGPLGVDVRSGPAVEGCEEPVYGHQVSAGHLYTDELVARSVVV